MIIPKVGSLTTSKMTLIWFSKPISIVFIFLISYSFCKKPYGKREQAIWKVECELGVIADNYCPVDGGWSPWGSWSACHGFCDDLGSKQRSRECINPPPSKEGSPCTGPSTQTNACYLTNCTVDDFRRLLSGDHLRTEALRQLEAVPALLERCLQMECPFEAIQAALATDNTWQLDPESLWNSLQCVKHNIGCSLAGAWSTWGLWSTCSARCGRGMRWRLRRCDTPPPSVSNLVCEGEPLQAEDCEGDQCAVDEHETRDGDGGTWSPWGEWSSCSEQCGAGARRRKRVCLERHAPHGADTWGTHCRGQHDQLETCANKHCALDGGWTGWGGWGPCSQTCGAGKRSRVRSCTRPVPSGGGTPCNGPRTEVGACYLVPCEARTHLVTIFNGEGHLQYNIENKHSTLIHVYVRFKPLSQYGTLFRRGMKKGPHIRVSLQRWHVCVDASGKVPSCSLLRLCSTSTLEPASWHSVMVSITTEAVFLQIDNSQINLKRSFPCNPELPEENLNFWIGERFYGEIQEVAVNFIPLRLKIKQDESGDLSRLTAYSASNVAYEKSSIDEAFLEFQENQYLRLPCFEDQDDWLLELKVKPRRTTGTLLFFNDDRTDNLLSVSLQNSRVKLKVVIDDFRSEGSSSTEYPADEWLDVRLLKKRETNAIEVKLNGEERIHVIVTEESERKRRDYRISQKNKINENAEDNAIYDDTSPSHNKVIGRQNTVPFTICNDEFYVGGIPTDVTKVLSNDITSFSGTIASLSINGVLQDLLELGMERNKDDTTQVSSRTASISESYHEVSWGKSKHLNLTCLHARTTRSPHSAQWLFLDTAVKYSVTGKIIRSVDDGRVLRLLASAQNELKGFYTCRAHENKRTTNVVTYGIIGQSSEALSTPDRLTAIAVCTTTLLVLITLGWLIIEGINDLRNGFGFFRDQHLGPLEEAEAICDFIDQNAHLIGSKSAIKMAKSRARRVAKRLSNANNNDQINNEEINLNKTPILKPSDDSSSHSESESLPALPEIPTFNIKPEHEIYRCEVSFVSSPRHGSELESSNAKFSTSTVDLLSPRVVRSHIVSTKRRYTPRSITHSCHKNSRNVSASFGQRRIVDSTMPTIKSSGSLNQSPGQKVLQKFKELK